MGRYNPHFRTGMYDPQIEPLSDAVRIRLAEMVAERQCAEGKHRWETDEVTGDERCRYCPAELT